MILSLGAGGQGLNLNAASYVFHFDRRWNRAVERQAEARRHRMGQARAVNVYTDTGERTINERIGTTPPMPLYDAVELLIPTALG